MNICKAIYCKYLLTKIDDFDKNRIILYKKNDIKD